MLHVRVASQKCLQIDIHTSIVRFWKPALQQGSVSM
jgi:hypothetical protein